jgi:hypothetical protein
LSLVYGQDRAIPPADLSRRRRLSLDLPEFLVRAFECRISEANDGATASEQASLENLIELELVDSLSLAEVVLERNIPGISEAVSRWLADIE